MNGSLMSTRISSLARIASTAQIRRDLRSLTFHRRTTTTFARRVDFLLYRGDATDRDALLRSVTMQEGSEKRGRRVCEVLRPVTLPVSEGGKTLRKLTLLGYDGARIYLSYNGAADAL